MVTLCGGLSSPKALAEPLEAPRPHRGYPDPVLRFHLLAGDRITARLQHFDGEAIHVTTLEGRSLSFPYTQLAELTQPEPESLFWPYVIPPEGNWKFALDDGVHLIPSPSDSSRWQYEFTRGPVSGQGTLRVALAGGRVELPCFIPKQTPALLEFLLDDGTEIQIQHRQGKFSLLKPRAGWSGQSVSNPGEPVNIVLMLRDGSCQLLVNRSGLAIGDSRGKLTGLRFHILGAFDQTTPPWLESFQVQPAQKLPEVSYRQNYGQSRMMDYNGGSYYGNLQEFTSHRIALWVGEKSYTGCPWHTLARYFPPLPPVRVASRELGMDRVELKPPVDHLWSDGDVYIGEIVSEDLREIVLQHTELGQLAFPQEQVFLHIRQPEQRRMLLSVQPLHLGDSVQFNFNRPRPEDGPVILKFEWKDSDRKLAVLKVQVSDVQPSGPGAPDITPHLQEVRAGQLQTRVQLNGKPVDNLNRHLNYEDGPQGTQWVRIPLPRDLLRSGENEIQFTQTPLATNRREFDDCQIHRVELELIYPRE